MTISKAQWSSDGDNLRLSMPFSKVDKERRIVSGFATLDNVDKQDDIVTADASMKAFAKFRGNIREMHQPLAVGKMVAFRGLRFCLCFKGCSGYLGKGYGWNTPGIFYWR
jgi:hypothetical protein